eukprot:9429229-Alexandrium_andersonii.AAC.1
MCIRDRGQPGRVAPLPSAPEDTGSDLARGGGLRAGTPGKRIPNADAPRAGAPPRTLRGFGG